MDGSKIHADASKSHAVSYGRLLKLETQLRAEVEELMALGAKADQSERPVGLDIETEVTFWEGRLVNLAEAKRILEAHAQERYAAEQAEYEAKLRAREEKARETERKPRGRAPRPPVAGPEDREQYNFTDPESRMMKHCTDGGFDQHYNVQVGVDQESLLIIAHTVSAHPNDKREAIPTVDAIPTEVGKPQAAALDHGYLSEETVAQLKARGIEPHIATGREPHHKSWRERFAEQPAPPADYASPIVKMSGSTLPARIGGRSRQNLPDAPRTASRKSEGGRSILTPATRICPHAMCATKRPEKAGSAWTSIHNELDKNENIGGGGLRSSCRSLQGAIGKIFAILQPFGRSRFSLRQAASPAIQRELGLSRPIDRRAGVSVSSKTRVSARNRRQDGTAHQGSVPQPLGENSIRCLGALYQHG